MTALRRQGYRAPDERAISSPCEGGGPATVRIARAGGSPAEPDKDPAISRTPVMTRRPKPTVIRRLGGLVAMIDGAVSAAIAAEAGHRPSPAALRRMGLPVDAFDGIRLR